MSKLEISKALLENRPKLTEKSINSYSSTLYNLPKKVNNNNDDVNIKWFSDNIDKIIKYLEKMPVNKRKSVLSAVYILTQNKKVQANMKEDINDYNNEIKKQTKSESQEKNWIEWEDVKKIHDEMEIEFNSIVKKKTIVQSDFFKLNKFVLLSCFVLNKPRRVMDYGDMMIKDYDKDKNNYYDVKKSTMVFNNYKTKGTYGRQEVKVNDRFSNILKKWIKINPSNFLILNSIMGQNTSSQMTKQLNDIFGKNISSNILRHSYLSHIYKNIPALEQMQNIAKDMGHSVSTALEYIKKDDSDIEEEQQEEVEEVKPKRKYNKKSK